MEVVMKHPDDAPVERLDDVVVVVACEDAATAPRVWSMLERIGHGAGGRGRLIYSWWTFAVLGAPMLRHLAAQEAAAADMVVIAAHRAASLPPSVRGWLSDWVVRSDGLERPRALVALAQGGLTHPDVSRGFVSELRGLAESGAVDFFAEGCETGQRILALRGAAPFSGDAEGGVCRPEVQAVGPADRIRSEAQGALR